MTNLFRRERAASLRPHGEAWTLKGPTAGVAMTISAERAAHVVEGGMFRRQSGVSGEACRG